MSGKTYILIVVGIVCLVGTMIVAIIMDGNKQRGVTKGDAAKAARKYNFLSENFLTRKTFRKIVEQLANMSIYSTLEIRKLAISYYTRSLGFAVAAAVIGIIIYRDIISAVLCIELSVVVFQGLIVSSLDAAHKQVLNEFSYTLSSLREAYTVEGNIPDAVNNCDKGRHLQQAMERIYLILTTTDAEDLLEDFYLSVPFPMLQTLAGLCYLMNDSGDEEDDSGQSAFKTAVTLIKDECDADVRYFTLQKTIFGMVQILPLAAPFLAGFLRGFVTMEMPGTSVVYNGMYGYLAQIVLILSAIIGYWYIGNVMSPSAVRRVDRSAILDKLVFWRPLQGIVKNIMPKYGRTIRDIEKRLDMAISNKDIRYLYTSKLVISVALCVFTLTATVVFIGLARNYVYNNIQVSSIASGNAKITVREANMWHEIDNKVLEGVDPPREHDLNVLIGKYFPDISALDMRDQCDRIITKYNDYHHLKFRWWYLLISVAGGITGWQVPNIMLELRRKRVKSDEEEDVLQIQTMIAVLRYTNLTTLDALFWMARQSRIYKSALLFAYYEYPSDPEMALTRLSDKSGLPAFKLICKRLLSTISDITIREAFTDLESERHHMLSIRETIQTGVLKKKRKKCSPYARASMLILFIGYFMIPIMIFAISAGYNMLKQTGMIG